MQPKQLNREKKIKFLSDFLNGKANIKDIVQPKYDVWFVLTDGSYENKKSHEIISKDEFQERFKDMDVITFK